MNKNIEIMKVAKKIVFPNFSCISAIYYLIYLGFCFDFGLLLLSIF